MTETGVQAFDNTLQKTNVWLKELAAELEWPDRDRPQAYMALRTVLHALRDRLGVAEAVQLGAQLPMLVRGFYYEGWRPAGKPNKEHREEFLRHVADQFQDNERDYLMGVDRTDPERITRAVFRLLFRHTTEADKLMHVLPAELRDLWPQPASR